MDWACTGITYPKMQNQAMARLNLSALTRRRVVATLGFEAGGWSWSGEVVREHGGWMDGWMDGGRCSREHR